MKKKSSFYHLKQDFHETRSHPSEDFFRMVYTKKNDLGSAMDCGTFSDFHNPTFPFQYVGSSLVIPIRIALVYILHVWKVIFCNTVYLQKMD